MKKVLLFSILALLTVAAPVLAYETIIVHYPPGELWDKVYYRKVGNEAILQYVPRGQTRENWVRTIIVHSYNHASYPVNMFMSNDLARLRKTNPNGAYKYLKNTEVDAMATRCTEDYKNIKSQCEFYRATRAHGGVITLHYINRNKQDFQANYEQWYEIIKRAVYYNTYYRDERTLDKHNYFEL